MRSFINRMKAQSACSRKIISILPPTSEMIKTQITWFIHYTTALGKRGIMNRKKGEFDDHVWFVKIAEFHHLINYPFSQTFLLPNAFP